MTSLYVRAVVVHRCPERLFLEFITHSIIGPMSQATNG
jgi:hypothetical protein